MNEHQANQPAALALLGEAIPKRINRILLGIGFWAVIGLGSAVHWWYINLYPGPYENFWQVLRVKLVVWWIWGLITPFLFWLGYRFRITRQHWLRIVTLHVSFAFLIGLIYTVLYATALIVNLKQPLGWVALKGMTAFVLSIHTTFFVLAGLATILLEQGISYFRDARERELRAAQLESKLAQAQWQNLRSQLNPHFLFNVLNTSASQLLASKQEDAHETLVKLSELLRMSLEQTESQFTSLKQEITFARKYLDLIRTRYPDKLRVTISVSPEAEGAALPSLVLQTLVENAIKHGISAFPESRNVYIEANIKDAHLYVLVANDGVSGDVAVSNGTGVGLKNLRERLAYLYQQSASLNLQITQSGRAEVTVMLPFEVYHDTK